MTKARDVADLGGGVSTADITDANVTQAKLAAEAVNEAKLQVSNAPTNGYALTAQSAATGGMTWAEAGGDPSGGSTSTVNLASTGGATLTGIPAAVQRLTVILEGFSDAGNSGLMTVLELGTSSALQTSGYVGQTAVTIGGSSFTATSSAAFVARVADGNNASGTHYVKYELIRMLGSNDWFETVSGMGKNLGIIGGSGQVTLSAELTKIRIWFYASSSPYTTNFSQGTIRLSWEY
mgnify:CR=1 FL=1